MGNKATGGPFSPLVVVVRNVIGEKDFNKLRGKGISLHSQGRQRAALPIYCVGKWAMHGRLASYLPSSEGKRASLHSLQGRLNSL